MGCSQGKSASTANAVDGSTVGITAMANEVSMRELQQAIGESMGETKQTKSLMSFFLLF